MPVIAVINRKGGSGKSTLSTHLASWLANQGMAVMLGDVDRQQSSRTWLRLRPADLPHIAGWTVDQKNILKVPIGITHVVLDTPGGMHGLELAKVIMSTDTVLMPVCNSLFDKESASACLQELRGLPRVASGRCRLGIVGMRVDARTHAAEQLQTWAAAHKVEFVGALRETQMYVRSLDTGTTIFDPHSPPQSADIEQWKSILEWAMDTERPRAPGQAEAAGRAPLPPGTTMPPVRNVLTPVPRDGVRDVRPTGIVRPLHGEPRGPVSAPPVSQTPPPPFLMRRPVA